MAWAQLVPLPDAFLWTWDCGRCFQKTFRSAPCRAAGAGEDTAPGYTGEKASMARGLTEVGSPRGHQSH